jgi:hypothetical protein
LRERDHLEDLDVKGRIIFKCIIKKSFGSVWTDVAQNRDNWWAVVNKEMKLVKNY